MWQRIKAGDQPLTEEGVVFQPREGGKPIKAKLRPERDVWVKNIVPGKAGAAAFEYSTSPTGPVVGKVGTGFTPKTRQEMLENPEAWIGRMARIESQGQFPSGAHRAPAFIALHEDYPAVDDDEDKKKLGSAWSLSQLSQKLPGTPTQQLSALGAGVATGVLGYILSNRIKGLRRASHHSATEQDKRSLMRRLFGVGAGVLGGLAGYGGAGLAQDLAATKSPIAAPGAEV
jgi:hypothetical protein